MIIVALVGLKKCGKTTTAETLIGEFKRRGLKVGSIKFMPHSTITLDIEGKDTWRHRNAGSDFVISLSKGEIGYIGDIEGRATLADAFKLIPEDTDVMICEGLNEDHPDIFRILLAKDPSLLEETYEVRGIPESEFDAISGRISNVIQEHGSLPVYNATDPAQLNDLVDLIIRSSK